MQDLDLINFLASAFKGVPLVFVVIGMTQWVKSLGAKGNEIRIFSMIWGVLIGGVYMVVTERPPAGDGWAMAGYLFGIALYGLSMGIVASGVYDATVGQIKSLVEQLLSRKA